MDRRKAVLWLLAILLVISYALMPIPGDRAVAKTALQPGNKNALMLEPLSIEANNTFEQVKGSLTNAGYNVTTVLGDDVRPESYKELYKYGVVFMFAHGSCWQDSEGNHAALQTRLRYSNAAGTGLRYWSEFRNGRLVLYGDYVYVTDRYLSHYNGDFAGSLVYMNSCHIMENDMMWNVVRDKGSKALCGFARGASTEEDPSKPRTKDDNATIDFFGEATKDNVDIEAAYTSAGQSSSVDPGWVLKTAYDTNTLAYYLYYREQAPPEIPDVNQERARQAANCQAVMTEYARREMTEGGGRPGKVWLTDFQMNNECTLASAIVHTTDQDNPENPVQPGLIKAEFRSGVWVVTYLGSDY